MITTVFLVICLVIIAIYAAALVMRYHPFFGYRLEEMPGALKRLLEYGVEPSFVIFQEMKTKRFLQFTKYSRNGKSGIELDLPKVAWTAPFFDKALNYIYEREIEYRIICRPDSDVVEALRADFGEDILVAFAVSKYIVHSIMNIPPDAKYIIKRVGIKPPDIKVLREIR